MSSGSAIRTPKQGARSSFGSEPVYQPGSLRRGVTSEPVQLSGPRVRTRIRLGAQVTGSPTMAEPMVVGIDVSKEEVAVAVHPTNEQWTNATTAAGVDALVARLRELTPTVIVVEATGGYEM